MKTDWLKLAGGLAVATSMLGASSVYAQGAGIDEWDTDGSGGINQEEWNEGFTDSGIYDDWDLNDDNSIDDNEFNQGVYNSYDANGDGNLDENEYGLFEDDAGENGIWDV